MRINLPHHGLWEKYKHFLTDRKFIFRVFVIFIILIGILAYQFFIYHFAYSRYAYIHANVLNINAQVSGQIAKIYIKNNQPVKKGEKLIQLDQRPYLYALDKAKANLEKTKVDYQTNKTAIDVANNVLLQKKANRSLIDEYLTRYKILAATGSVAEIRYIDYFFRRIIAIDETNHAANELLLAQQALTDAQIKHAQALLEIASYNYNQTIIYAPVDGLVTNMELIVGDYVNSGQNLFALVDTNQWWVITRYRETVLRKIKIGDKVNISIDMYPQKTFHGIVESIDWGINRAQSSPYASPSTLPYVEPTEYWIRLSQRFPVWIRIIDVNDKYPLRSGANARTYVISNQPS